MGKQLSRGVIPSREREVRITPATNSHQDLGALSESLPCRVHTAITGPLGAIRVQKQPRPHEGKRDVGDWVDQSIVARDHIMLSTKAVSICVSRYANEERELLPSEIHKTDGFLVAGNGEGDEASD